MFIKSIKAPWQRKSGSRAKKDSFYQSSSWKRLVNQVWQRDGSLCQLCLQNNIIHRLERGTKDYDLQGTVDHKVRREEGGTDELDNLWLIGSRHHAKKDNNAGRK